MKPTYSLLCVVVVAVLAQRPCLGQQGWVPQRRPVRSSSLDESSSWQAQPARVAARQTTGMDDSLRPTPELESAGNPNGQSNDAAAGGGSDYVFSESVAPNQTYPSPGCQNCGQQGMPGEFYGMQDGYQTDGWMADPYATGPGYGPGYSGYAGYGPGYGYGGYGGYGPGYGYGGFGIFPRLRQLWQNCLRQYCCGTPYRRIYAEYLYLRPGNDKISYALPINGAIVPPVGAGPVPIGPEAEVDIDFSSGYRVGWDRAVSCSSSIGLMYSRFESSARHSTSIDPPFAIRSLVSHPGTQAAPTDFLTAAAESGIDFKLFDLHYSHELLRGCRHSVDYLIGLRYANLGQGFNSVLTNSTTLEMVGTDVDFDGGGLRMGIEGEHYFGNRCWMVYGRVLGSLLGGEFSSFYRQSDSISGTISRTSWKDDRLITVLDLELGVGWTSPSQHWRFTAGWMFSGWYNLVTTESFIHGVRSNFSGGIRDRLTFEGLTASAEFRY